MSGDSENSDSWGSLLIDGIMTKMVQVSGLRVVKSSDRNGDQKHLQEKAKQLPKKLFAEKDKNDLQPKKFTGKPNRSHGPQSYTGWDKYHNIDPEQKNDAFFNKRIANHNAKKELNDKKLPTIVSKTMKIHKEPNEIRTTIPLQYLYYNPIVKENDEKLEVKNEQESEHSIENKHDIKLEVKNKHRLDKIQVLDSDFMELQRDKEEFKIAQQFPSSDIVKNDVNDKIKIEPPPLSDYEI